MTHRVDRGGDLKSNLAHLGFTSSCLLRFKFNPANVLLHKKIFWGGGQIDGTRC